ncbi:hypothetical protein VP01_1925g2 [Puccinia sorghi]|uniref:VTT domain-containing protein n=1 Tax=Puccinia sorghi TaxID=27349 RepID=A0A0L6VCM8_9BASI|nr:hypothetical protein VP01_1925g2 [Puccinia sorghi]
MTFAPDRCTIMDQVLHEIQLIVLSRPLAFSVGWFERMSLLKSVTLLVLISLLSLAIISVAVNTLPGLRLPTSLERIQQQLTLLRKYNGVSPASQLHLLAVLSLIFVSKQAFSIPGTALLNILIGALYPSYIATPLTCLLTAIGSTAAYHLAATARPLFLLLIPKPLKLIQRAVDPLRVNGSLTQFHDAQLASYLLIARLLPIVPYAALNLASGVLQLPLVPFFWTLLIGSLPYNLLTTQLGDILRIASESPHEHPGLTEIWTAGLLVKLASLSLLAILPVLFKEALRTAIQKLSLLLARSAVAPDLKPIEQSLSSLVDGEASQSMKHSLKHHLFCDTNPLPSPSFSTISRIQDVGVPIYWVFRDTSKEAQRLLAAAAECAPA